MEEKSCASSDDDNELLGIRQLLWGPTIKHDVFNRWSQGFEFSDIEPSALVQRQGGPCGVLAPVQAFLLKILLMETPGYNISDLTPDKCKTLLIQALCNILMKCKERKYRIVTVSDGGPCSTATNRTEEELVGNYSGGGGSSVSVSTTNTLLAQEEVAANENDENQMSARNDSKEDDDYVVGGGAGGVGGILSEWTPDQFHERLTVLNLESIDDVEKFYSENFPILTRHYGVLLFLYTVLLTKELENVVPELSSDTSEPLIHSVYGYGSQALINLMLTGRAVAHVWDNDQDIGGLKLRGINQQSDIGFITLMEQMRYCTVGSFYKNPKNPVWVMASETHLTVLFSNEKRLVSPETPCEIARRVFRQYDPEGNNFIPSVVLQDVLCALDLVSEPEYVDIMLRKLDPENLGIILLNSFMDEFFPEEKRSMPDTFDLLHYNGIPGSNFGNKVKFNKGSAILLESDLKMCNLSNAMLTCLQTKWPNIEVNWHDMRTPSLN